MRRKGGKEEKGSDGEDVEGGREEHRSGVQRLEPMSRV